MPDKTFKTASDSIENTRRYHERYFRAISSPLRRKILKTLKTGRKTVEDLQSKTGLDGDILKWHLSILEHDYCVKKEIKQGKQYYRLTQEGKVVDYLE